MVRGLAAALGGDRVTAVVNVGDDDRMYGLHVAADADTVVYTLAGIEGPQGWGLADDGQSVMAALAELGVDTTFRLGDRDLAHCLWRTGRMADGAALSTCIAELATALGVATTVLPASDDPVRTRVHTGDGEWIDFQDYFVRRGHRDPVTGLDFVGSSAAAPAPGVVDALRGAELVVIAPSNPPLSIWPILAVPGIRDAVATAGRVIAVSPLFAGKPLKGPADRVMEGLGLPGGNAGVLAAYDGLISDLVVDVGDEGDVESLGGHGVAVHAVDTRIGDVDGGKRLAAWLLDLAS